MFFHDLILQPSESTSSGSQMMSALHSQMKGTLRHTRLENYIAIGAIGARRIQHIHERLGTAFGVSLDPQKLPTKMNLIS